MEKEEFPLKKVCIICSKGSLESVYPALVLANGALLEGIEVKLFFTFFGLDAINKKCWWWRNICLQTSYGYVWR